ncbi:MAG: glycine cleavage system protein GcvH [Spirochaetes bacterium]|nr:glycine cleavage system protein GcvH [Spirochaetota bacterium]
MEIKDSLLYTPSHEWLKKENGSGIVGITDYAQNQLGDIVFIEMPEVGKTYAKGESFGSIESVKAVSDLYAPVDFEVVQVNDTLSSSPELVNKDPYGQGWMLKIKIKDDSQVNQLLKSEDYKKSISS